MYFLLNDFYSNGEKPCGSGQFMHDQFSTTTRVFRACTLDSLISVGLCLLISRIFSRVYDLIREVFSIAIGIKFEIFNFSSKLSVIQHYFCFFCKISRVYAYFSGQIFQRLCLFKGLCLLESLE